MSIKKIGVENFRVFKNYTEFEIRPITLLTGPNNSGKSSFSKLLLLLDNGLEKLSFEKGTHNLENFSSVLSWDNSSKEKIKILLKNPLSLLQENSDLLIEYDSTGINYLSIIINGSELYSISFSPKTESEIIGFNNPFQLKFNIEALIEIIYNKEFLLEYYRENVFPHSEFNYIELKEDFVSIDEFQEIPDDYKNLKFDNLISTIQEKIDPEFNDGTIEKLRLYAISNELKEIKKDYILYNVIYKTDNLRETMPEQIREWQKEVFEEIDYNILGFYTDPEDEKAVITEIFKSLNVEAKSRLKNKVEKNLGLKEIKLEESSLGNLVFKQKLFSPSNQKEVFQNTFIDEIKNFSFSLSKYIDKIDFVSANRGNQKRVLLNSSENEIDEIVLKFSKLHESKQNLNFLKDALKVFQIEGELDVIRYENFISVISLINNGKQSTLADLGYGYSQIIPIILKVILSGAENYKKAFNLIIEEPEANLHPNLQSRFADFLALCLEEYPNVNFIIETHSEYLLRKLQYLSATGDLYSNESVVYYFNDDKYVSNEEPKVKKIEIDQNGNLSDSFGPGFYDEATQLQFDLIKINKEQNN